jgi:hypothetical protein
MAVEELYKSSTGTLTGCRIAYKVTAVQSEHDALVAALNVSPKYLPLSGEANPNKRMYRWDAQMEEIRLTDPLRVTANASFKVTIEYRQRAVCPKVVNNFATETETIYQGEGTPVTVVRDGQAGNMDSVYGINQESQNGQLTVRGTTRRSPIGSVKVTWHPLTAIEATGPYLSVDAVYLRRAHDQMRHVHKNGWSTAAFNTRFLDTWNPGEAMLVGFNATRISETLGLYELTFDYEIRINKPTLTIDGLTLNNIEGHDYVWGERADAIGQTTSGAEQKKYLWQQYWFLRHEKIYPRADLNKLFYNQDGANMVTGCEYFTQTAGPNYPNWSAPTIPTWPTTP